MNRPNGHHLRVTGLVVLVFALASAMPESSALADPPPAGEMWRKKSESLVRDIVKRKIHLYPVNIKDKRYDKSRKLRLDKKVKRVVVVFFAPW